MLVSFILLYLSVGPLPTPIPYTGIFLTPLPCAGWSFYLLLCLTLISFTPSTLYWSLYPLLPCTGLFHNLVLVFLPSFIPYTGLFHPPLPCTDPLLYLKLASFTPLYMVVVFLPNSIHCVGLFLTHLS